MPSVPQSAVDRLTRIGGEKLLIRILEMFIERAPALEAEARDAHASADLERRTRSAHSLKSAAANLELEELRQAAFRLEQASSREDADAVERAFAELGAHVGAAVAAAQTAREAAAS